MKRAQRVSSFSACVLALTAAWIARPLPARACTPDPCPDPVRTFGEHGYVPGNLVRFPLRAGVDPSQLNLELRTADGELVPASVQGDEQARFFAADSTMPPDTELVLSYTRVCNQWAEVPGPETVEYAFSTFAAEPVELVPPELTLSEQGQMFPGPGFPEHVFKRYRLYTGVNPSVAGHITELSATVDGMRIGIDERGAEPVLTLTANCEQTEPVSVDSCGGGGPLSPGKHILEIHSRVLGEAPRPTVTLEVELECGVRSCTAEPPMEGGASGAGSAAMDDDANASSSGCSAAPLGRSSSSGALGLAIGLLAMIARRRVRMS